MAERTLTDLEVRILDFARRYPGSGETWAAVALEEFGWMRATFQMRLNALLDLPAAEMHDPMLVHRLRKLRDERADARRDRTFRQAQIVSAG